MLWKINSKNLGNGIFHDILSAPDEWFEGTLCDKGLSCAVNEPTQRVLTQTDMSPVSCASGVLKRILVIVG